MSLVPYNYNNAGKPEIKQAIDNALNMKYMVKTMNTAYGVLLEHRNTQEDPIFNQYFEVVPSAPIDQFGPKKGLEDVIRHGMIISCPNVKDEDLPPEALVSRERAVAKATLAATYVSTPPVNQSKGTAPGVAA